MELFRRIFLAAVLAGAVAGLGLATVQQWRVVPLILEAETYEVAAHSRDDAVAETTPNDDEVEVWAPAGGIERTAFTVLATILAGLGFALVTAAVSTLTGLMVTVKNGVIWGLGGFAAFSMAPAFGLPPELPGMPAADLVMRQVWWWGTVIATGAGILAIARLRNWTGIGIGVVLIALPHLIGAPAAPEEHSDVPAHLASAYVTSALAASMIFWLILGPLLGKLNERFGAGEAA
jgi:cobalt transporter subunit CbtA